jgi:putative restriction endonuclease
MEELQDYIKKFEKLRTDISPARWSVKTCHRAPHKPLLLLAVMDLFAEGTIKANFIEITSDLGELFSLYWSRVMPPDRRGNLALPFFFLKSEGFWHLIPQPDKGDILAATSHIRSVKQLYDLVMGAKLDEELFKILQVEKSRNQLRTVLIQTYFAPELRPGLIEQGLINTEAYQYSQELLEQARIQGNRAPSIKEEPYRPAARNQGFRRAVVIAYEHRCAFCGIRMMSSDGHTVVDAAHIIPWSVSHNDNPRNGMALCKLCHWTFDEGMIGVSQKYLVITSPQLVSNRNIPAHLSTLNGRPIFRPAEEILWPDLAAFLWHHKVIFRKR